MTVLARDISNYDGTVSAETIRSWDIGHLVIRTPLPWETNYPTMLSIARSQVQAGLDAGCTVSGYPWAYFTEDAALTAMHAGLFWSDLGVVPTMIWMDCEDTKWVKSPAENVTWLQQCLGELTAVGLPVGVYTGDWWWHPYMANSVAFTGFPLWTAEYDGVPDLTVWNAYGGWTQLAGKQYTGNPHDLDIFADSATSAGDDMSQVNELNNLLGYLRGDVATALQDALDSARAATTKAARTAAYDSLQAAVDTLKRGGAAA